MSKYTFWVVAHDPNTNKEMRLEWNGLSSIAAETMFIAAETMFKATEATGVGLVTRFGWESSDPALGWRMAMEGKA